MIINLKKSIPNISNYIPKACPHTILTVSAVINDASSLAKNETTAATS